MDNKKSTKELYKDTFQMIRPSDHSVTQMLYRTEENKMRTKRLMPRRRVIVLTTICCMLFASACFAASMIVNYEGHAPSTPQCTNYDDLSSITNDLGYEATIPESFSNGYVFENATLGTEEGKDADGKLLPHLHKFGFILRYPAGKESVTGYPFEPWHIRYVGIDAAREMYDAGWTLEEYVSRTREELGGRE